MTTVVGPLYIILHAGKKKLCSTAGFVSFVVSYMRQNVFNISLINCYYYYEKTRIDYNYIYEDMK